MNVIAIANQKGGVGKTTSTIELATAIHKKGKRVLVIDFDQQCNLSKYTNADTSKPTIADVLQGESSVTDAIQSVDGFFDLIQGAEELSKADKQFTDLEDQYLLADIAEIIQDDYDYVFIDNSPSRNILLTMAYIASDNVIIPTECDEGSKDGIVAIEGDINKLTNGRHAVSHAKVMGYILTKHEKTIMHDLALEDLQELASEKDPAPFIMSIHKSINLSKVKTLRTSVTEYEKDGKPAQDYLAIANEIIRRVEG